MLLLVAKFGSMIVIRVLDTILEAFRIWSSVPAPFIRICHRFAVLWIAVPDVPRAEIGRLTSHVLQLFAQLARNTAMR